MRGTVTHNISKGLLFLVLMTFLASSTIPYYMFNKETNICVLWDLSDTDSEEKKETEKKKDKIRSNERFTKLTLAELTLIRSCLSNFYSYHYFDVATPPPKFLS